jgi:hypothetical protein
MLKILAPRAVLLLVLGLAVLAVLPATVPAQDTKTDRAPPPDETEEEKKERAERRTCAVSICATLHNRKPADGIVTCNIPKTWRKEALTKILSRGKVSWPWGDMRCVADVKIDRALLVKAMQEPEFEAQFETHGIRCQIDNAKDKYEVTAQIRPKVSFKEGKAVKAAMNWGKIEAPILAKSALWSVTAADNTFGLLQTTAVEDINEFINTRCMEVKEEWQGK